MKRSERNKKRYESPRERKTKVEVKKKSNEKIILSDSEKIILALITFILLVISLLFLKLYLTIALVLGIIIIYYLSKLLNKLRRKKPWRVILNIFAGTLMVIFSLVLIFISILIIDIVKTAPEFNAKLLRKRESTIIYDANNKMIAEVGDEKRDNKTYDDYSENLINAIIATEDARFFQHNGFDAPRFIKASIGQLMGRQSAGGASTLSMQVVKNTYTDNEKIKKKGWEKLKRKFTDIYLSVFKLEKNYTKQEILQFYANNHELNPRAWGVEKTAEVFFGKNAKDLTLSEAAMIAGMFQAPTTYNPFVSPDATEKRRDTVLNLMKRHGYITEEERKNAASIPVKSLLNPKVKSNKFQGYIDTVISELEDKGYNPYKESLQVYTNLDSKRQAGIEEYIDKKMKWENSKTQVGAAVLDVNTGKIVAVLAGRNRTAGDFNNATRNTRQIGSTAKPIFDYGPGIEFNNWSTAKIFYDKPYSYSGGTRIRNHDNRWMGRIDLCSALGHSRNPPALQAFQQVDNKKINNFVRGLGITPDEENGKLFESHALGAFSGSTPVELAAAYAAFANGGTYYKPYAVRKVVDRLSGEKKEYQPEGKKAMSDSTAYMITYCLEKGAKNALASQINPRTSKSFAAKTGTTTFSKEAFKTHKINKAGAINDLWSVSYDTEHVMSLWYGYQKINRNYISTGRSYSYYYKLSRELGKIIFKSKEPFKVPKSVVKKTVDFLTNPPLLASPSTPAKNKREAYFKRGTEPTEKSNISTKLSNVKGLTYTKVEDGIKLSWSPVENPIKDYKEEDFGKFGYRIYRDNAFITFTTDTSYVNKNDNYYGKYTVITCYENLSESASSGASISVLPNYNIRLTVKDSKTYFVGGAISEEDKNPKDSDISVVADGKVVDFTTKISIYKDGTNTNEITSDEKATYRIVYNIYHLNRLIGTKERIIKIM